MTLKEIINALNKIAISQPLVNSVVKTGDIYSINENPDTEYSVFCAVQQTHNLDPELNIMSYNFVLYYVDRLTSDKNNKIDVQSTGLQVLTNIVKKFADEYEDVAQLGDNISFEVFTDSFNDLCAGAYATVTILADVYPCIETY